MGQVINNTYYDWHAFYASVNEQRRLICISMDRPSTRQLTVAEATAFLTDSFHLNAPAETERSAKATPETEEPIPAAQPEPLLREQDTRLPKAAPANPASELPPQGVEYIPSSTSADVKASKSASAVEAPKTIGTDDRQAVTTPNIFPWNTVGFLIVKYPDGQSFRCSGILAWRDTVLTAGHCVYNKNRGGFASAVRFYPGHSPLYSGATSYLSSVAAMYTTQAWKDISGNDAYPVTDFKNDIAAIKFNDAAGSLVMFMPVMYSNTESPVVSAGYPAVVRGTSTEDMFTHTGSERRPELEPYHVREFSIDASGGNSGGPFFFIDPETQVASIVGLLSYGEELNDRAGGPWYDAWNGPLVASWLGRTFEQPAAVIGGLRVPSVFSSARSDVQSYLRFYNGSAVQTGTVDVTLYDSGTGANLGTWRSPPINPNSSPQFYIKTLEDFIGITNKPALYTLSVRPTFTGYFQHVVWQLGPGTLANLTTCAAGVTTDPYLLSNVHSSLLQSNFPGSIMIHNTGTTEISPTLVLFDYATGNRLGGYTIERIPANALRFLPVTDLEKGMGLHPEQTGTYQYVVKAEIPFGGYLQQFSSDARSGKINDMTAMCAMSP